VEAGRVYADFGTFGTVCLDSVTGQVIWKRQLPVDHHHGPGSSPVLYKNLLMLVRDGRDQQYVTALNKQTGETVWKTDRPRSAPHSRFRKSFSTPLVFAAGGRTQMVVRVPSGWCPTNRRSAGNLARRRRERGNGGTPSGLWRGPGVSQHRRPGQPGAALGGARGRTGRCHSDACGWKLPTPIGSCPRPCWWPGTLPARRRRFISCLDASNGECWASSGPAVACRLARPCRRTDLLFQP